MSESVKKSLLSGKPTEYDGNTLKRLDWVGLFTTTVPSSHMTNAEIMTHLQTLVTGPAKNLICGYGYHDNFYKDTIEKLRNNFGEPNKVVPEYLHHIKTSTFEIGTTYQI